ncbi:MAG: type I glutamate--ammonia ligase [Candidatus Aminicenantes bacterium]|nr:type I glutamate--ammonia ligase [Candidatus Aminicenantes bacterium]
MNKNEVLKVLQEEKVNYLRLQFTDIMGINKNVEVPPSQFEKALEGKILFDGSSIEGFSRIEESDMLLCPDPGTLIIYPWNEKSRKEARLICDIYNPDDTPFEGCPRGVLKRAIAEADEMGVMMNAGLEAEFFLFEKDEKGEITTNTHDAGGYFDLTPIDKGEEARQAMVDTLCAIGFEVETAHHEVAPGQHEIDFKYADALTSADRIATFRFVVRKVATHFDLHATFMPKPIFGESGSGMHTHQSLFAKDRNVFYDEKGKYRLSTIALNYIAGLLQHAKGITAITNPLVNSYKRLVPGYEAPTFISWSERNRSPLVRVPAKRGIGTRIELRSPDPSANPYLALAVMLKAGLDGIKKNLLPPDPVDKNMYTMSKREKARLKIGSLPGNLSEALYYMGKDKLVKAVLGSHIYDHFVGARRKEWELYIQQVHPWEIDRYLSMY